MIRTTISLPNGSGKTSKICAFTDWNPKELLDAGAVIAWWEELIEDIEKWNVTLSFDVCVATPSMMRNLWKIARVLWPKWLMPNPKTGTVTQDLVGAIKEIAAWKFEFKTDKQWNIHSIFGKLSFGAKKLEENLNYFLKVINDVKPTWVKWKYINSIYICNAMGPGIRLDLNGIGG
jgi:large subunit ribosomal protein L1